MVKKKITAIISLVLCLLIAFSNSAVAVQSENQFLKADSISITRQRGIIKGESIQLTAEVEPKSAAVEWYSSNPDVISCDKYGKIKGEKAGSYAIIYCKSKYGSVKSQITVYCVKSVYPEETCSMKNSWGFIYSKPTPLSIPSLYVDIFSPGSAFGALFKFLASSANRTTLNVLGLFTFRSGFNVCGRYEDYVYIRIDGVKSNDGFVKYSDVDEEIEGFLNVTPTDMNVWGNGVVNTDKKLTTDYDGDVKWTYDKNYVKFDEETGQVIGLKSGVTTITAKADGMTAECTVHLLYKWTQEWVTETNKATSLYKAIGSEYDARVSLPKGTEVTVYGDSGTSDGWAFACYTDGEKEWWGHIPIADVSTKNTISYYYNLNWGYPLKNKDYNYINSPYAPRPSLNDEHRGFDINEKDNQADIAGQALVAPFDGVVKWVGADLNTSNGCGYYICITSKNVDPVTGKNLIAIYQHMQSNANFSINETVKKGDIVGYAGNTGRSNGSHLHFEVNNWNARIGEAGRSDFTYTINPIYFYLDMVENEELILNMDCSAVNSGYSFYFYNYDK